MLRNTLAAVGLYVVGKKILSWYMDYRVLKEDQERRTSRASNSSEAI